MTSDAPPRPCPRCGSSRTLRVVYGLPDLELVEASQRGDVALGGCIVEPEAPDYECGGCGAPLPWVAPAGT
jgi:hypothetical protein